MLYLTYLLQPLNISVLDSLKQNYKKLLYKKTCFLTYNIDKTDIILLIQKTRQKGITSWNIQSTWQAIGLIPYNLAMVFRKLSVNAKDISVSNKNNTGASSNTFIQIWIFLRVILPTSGDVEQVTEIEELISLFRHQTLDLPKLTLLYKTLKAARLAMADSVVLNCTNTEIFAANTRKKRRIERTGIAYNGQGARVLSLKDVKERKQLAENKRKRFRRFRLAREVLSFVIVARCESMCWRFPGMRW